jgi:hypothetical protein
MSMAKSWAAAFKVAPQRKLRPAMSMVIFLPNRRVVKDAKKLATRAAR